MSRSRKIFLGILTVLPFVFLVVYLVIFLNSFFEMIWYHRGNQEDFFFHMIPAFIFLALLILFKIGLLIYYIMQAVNNKRIDSTERIVWILVFIFAGLIGYPIYWYMRIWKEDEILQTPQVL